MYIGTQPYQGFRARHTYTATAGQTSFSGAGAENVTLTYSDEMYIDVYQNGVKLSPADYTATSGTTVVLAQGASVNDIVEVVKYDAFSVADTVSAKDGGGFGGNISTSGTLAVTGTSTLTGNTTVGGTLAVTGTTTLSTKLATSNLGAGAVLQVVSTAKTDVFSSSSTSFTDVTGLSVAITPSSSSNKILVSVHLMSAATGANSPRFNLVRGSTNIATSDGSTPASLHLNTSGSTDGRMGSIVFLDSPSTTSETTYKIQGLTDGNSFVVNRRGDDANKTSISTITVMEIAG